MGRARIHGDPWIWSPAAAPLPPTAPPGAVPAWCVPPHWPYCAGPLHLGSGWPGTGNDNDKTNKVTFDMRTCIIRHIHFFWTLPHHSLITDPAPLAPLRRPAAGKWGGSPKGTHEFPGPRTPNMQMNACAHSNHPCMYVHISMGRAQIHGDPWAGPLRLRPLSPFFE